MVHGQEDQEQLLVPHSERPAWLKELQPRIGELARETPMPKPSARHDGTAIPPRQLDYRPRR